MNSPFFLFDAHLPGLLRRLWRFLSTVRQRQFMLVMGLTLVSAFSEIVSLGAVLPFLGVLIQPERVYGIAVINHLAHAWGINSASQLILPLALIFVAVALLTGAIRLLLLWAMNRLACAVGTDISFEVYRRTLYQPYLAHVSSNSSEVISGISGKVSSVVFGVLLPLLTLASSAVLLVTIMVALIAINPIVALISAAGFGASYGIITWLSRRRLRQNSQRIAHEQTQVIKALQEGLGGIRDVLLHGTQEVYCKVYRCADRPLRQAQADNIFIGGSPRPAMEAIGMALIALLAYGLSLQEGGIAVALPTLGALALGAQRLLPALQQAYGSWTSILGNQISLADVMELLEQPMPRDVRDSPPARLPFEQGISFDDVHFCYAKNGPWVLSGVNLSIRKGARVGFVGSTGGGKSTLLDLLMGLLMPIEGEIRVDGITLDRTSMRAWQQNIAHVPQSIYLADATLAENIAFGIPREEIDFNRVRQAARQAQIADFIESRPEGYEAYVGERGISLSGGQRQRIGIARALYRQATVLVFDEATSALDEETEQAVMAAIEGLGRDMTILIIAHRTATLKHCDTIVKLEHGRVTRRGTYQEVIVGESFNAPLPNSNGTYGV